MEETFFQKLQRVKPKDFAHIFLFLLALLPALIYRLFRKHLWLLCDNENEARDNGWHLFCYLCREHPEIDAVYAISYRSPDCEKVRAVGKTVRYGSLKHWILYLAAEKNISSQKGGKPNAAVCNVLEVNGILRNKRIFLQHGIIKDDMPWLHYDQTKMSLFVTSVKREQDFISKTFGYPEGAVKELGLCRFDNLHSFEVKPKQILLMPSWRSWISTPTSASFEIEDVREFTNTTYYKAWNTFLQSEKLHHILQQCGLTLIFYPHRDMQQYLPYFHLTDKNIITASFPEYDVQQLLKESAYLITDFSSIAMDFAYMNKRLTYYQFDYDDFRKGQYPEGYFSYENDGFGKVCYTLEPLLEEIHKAAAEEFANPEEYRRRHCAFFDLHDDHNCERNYTAIKELK